MREAGGGDGEGHLAPAVIITPIQLSTLISEKQRHWHSVPHTGTLSLTLALSLQFVRHFKTFTAIPKLTVDQDGPREGCVAPP